jgi:hypothetical protein
MAAIIFSIVLIFLLYPRDVLSFLHQNSLCYPSFRKVFAMATSANTGSSARVDNGSDAKTISIAAKPAPQAMSLTFHRRTLPKSCIALSSPEGKKLFAFAHAHGGLKSFFELMEHFLTQSEPAYCGISTLVMTLNALAVDPRVTWKGPWRWYEESMLNCCIDLELVSGKQ